MKRLAVIFLMLFFNPYFAQAGFWDWLPGNKKSGRSCRYSEKELQSILPIEKQRAWRNTPTSYPVEAFNIQSAFQRRPWLRDFRYVIVVNKSDQGTTAQTAMVFEDGYRIMYDYVSTGREKLELRRRHSGCEKQPPNSYYSVTATGYYPVQQLVVNHRSESFDAAMPYSVFYDRRHGMALHQVMNSHEKKLGTRASGGCTRLRRDVARDLFNRIQKTRGSEIPVIRPDGSPVLDRDGRVLRSNKITLFGRPAPAYSAIVIIQDVRD